MSTDIQKSEVVVGPHGPEIRYLASKDCGPLAGLCLTGGVPANVGGATAVRFKHENVRGKWMVPTVRVDGRPDLAQLVSQFNALIEERHRMESWRPEGYEELLHAMQCHDHALEEWNQGGRRSPLGPPSRAPIERLMEQYPAAALFHEAVLLEQKAVHPDPTGRFDAARECKRLIRDAGDIAAAKAALAVRKNGFVE